MEAGRGWATAQDGHLDAVGGQPILPAAAIAQDLARAEAWADPTRLHHAGRRAGALLDAARVSIADSLTAVQVPGADPILPEEVFLTGSLARAQVLALAASADAVAIGAVEAAALLDLAEARPGARVVPVDHFGRVDPAGFAGAATRVLQAANPEVGTRQPVDAVGPGPLILDAGQCIGRIPLPGNWTTLVASARDWAGPAGLAICVVRGGRRPAPALRGWLEGFPDIPAAVGAATALEALLPHWQQAAVIDRERIDAVRQAAARIGDVEVVGDPDDRLPHVVTFSVLYVSGEALVHALDAQGLAVASGSACVDESARPSHVLAAMGAYTGGNVRVSLPFGCTDRTVERLIEVLPAAIARLRDDVMEGR
jgi:cysteine desulfurase